MTNAFLIVRRNQELKDVPLEHTIIGTTEVIGIAVTEEERDTALQQNRGAHALEMKRLGQTSTDGPEHTTNVVDEAADAAHDKIFYRGVVNAAKQAAEMTRRNMGGVVGVLTGSEFYAPKDQAPDTNEVYAPKDGAPT